MAFCRLDRIIKKPLKLYFSLIIVVTISFMNQMPYSSNYYFREINDNGPSSIYKDENITYAKSLPKFQRNSQDIQSESWKDKIKILCWIMTQPIYHEERAIHVRNTWGKRCDKLLFISSINDVNLPSIGLVVNDSYDMVWGKTKAAFKYVYDNYINEYTWFMKADDDTYVILENLRFFLRMYEPDEDAIYFGHKYKLSPKRGFMDGGGGYVLSRKALKLFVEKSLPNATLCRQDDKGPEDLEIGHCLANVGVIAGDTRDSRKRAKFFHFEPGVHLMPGYVPVEHRGYSYYPITNETDCCSDLAISFHWVDPVAMYEMDYLIYQLHPHGVRYSDPDLPSLPPDKESVPQRVIQNQ